MTNTVKVEKAKKREIQDLIIAGVSEDEVLGEKLGKLTLPQAEALAQVMANVYATLLLDNKKAPIGDLGYLEPKERAGRTGINPKLLKELKEQGVPEENAKKQASLEITPSVGIGFKIGKHFKEELKEALL